MQISCKNSGSAPNSGGGTVVAREKRAGTALVALRSPHFSRPFELKVEPISARGAVSGGSRDHPGAGWEQQNAQHRVRVASTELLNPWRSGGDGAVGSDRRRAHPLVGHSLLEGHLRIWLIHIF